MRIFMIIILGLLLIVLAVVFYIQEFYVPIKNISYKYSSTDFIEPPQNFVKCYEEKDCIKVKGSACSPESGGTEVCVNKNYFQEYLSEIEEKAGKQGKIACPEIYLVSNKTCDCIENLCSLV